MKREANPTLVSLDEYRQLLSDNHTGNEQAMERLRYIEALCRNLIKNDLRKLYDKAQTKGKTINA